MVERPPSRADPERRPTRPGRARRMVVAILGAGAMAFVATIMRPAPAPASPSSTGMGRLSQTTVATTTATTVTATTATTSATAASTAPSSTARTTTSSIYRVPATTPYYYQPSPTLAIPTTTTAPATTTTTTVAPLNGHFPVTPSTLPLTTKKQNGHVSPVFAELSGAGFVIALLLVSIQAILTRRGGRGHSL